MENTLNQYKSFYRALVRFEDEFRYKVIPNYPAALSNVLKIHYIIHPNDEDFSEHRTERVVQKVRVV